MAISATCAGQHARPLCAARVAREGVAVKVQLLCFRNELSAQWTIVAHYTMLTLPFFVVTTSHSAPHFGELEVTHDDLGDLHFSQTK